MKSKVKTTMTVALILITSLLCYCWGYYCSEQHNQHVNYKNYANQLVNLSSNMGAHLVNNGKEASDYYLMIESSVHVSFLSLVFALNHIDLETENPTDKKLRCMITNKYRKLKQDKKFRNKLYEEAFYPLNEYLKTACSKVH